MEMPECSKARRRSEAMLELEAERHTSASPGPPMGAWHCCAPGDTDPDPGAGAESWPGPGDTDTPPQLAPMLLLGVRGPGHSR